ncbi:PD-(D/E)XK nuclease family transposase [Fibrobacter succinogenes]|uniref:PD-(D/E)XK nuclease family transposase n=1 Tax=Fibrobacter succinogenes TaxID=833 RepID=UPI0015680662|nr:PD-(D/E)XK nuclease family transposase [Fibrobacter succinogenes]
MNRTQHYSLLRAMEIDKKNLLKYQEIYNYAYILSDGIFKIVFAEEKDHTLLISLVNAMLDLHGGETIKEITLEMQEFPGAFTKKDCIVDIIGTTNAGERVLVEVVNNLIPVSKTSFGQEWIQTSFGYQAAKPLSRNKIAEPQGQQQGDEFYRDRVEYYMSRVIENQVHTSEKYELPRIYFLGLLDFTLFPEEPQKYIHHVDEMCNGRKFFPKIQKIFVEIEKFFRLEEKGITTNDNSEAAQWLRAIKVTINEEPVPEKIMQNETFRRLLDSVKLINFAEELFNCEIKNVTDLMAEHEIGFAEGKKEGHAEGFVQGKTEGHAEGHEAGLAEGRAEGFAQGKTEGHAEGREAGLAEGREAGRAEGFAQGKTEGLNEGELRKAREIAKGLRDDGVPMEIIVRRSGLSEDEIRKL